MHHGALFFQTRTGEKDLSKVEFYLHFKKNDVATTTTKVPAVVIDNVIDDVIIPVVVFLRLHDREWAGVAGGAGGAGGPV